MKDLIERQRVSDLFDAWEAAELDHHISKILRDGLKTIPSVQPEIIHCKDCRFWQNQEEGVVEVPICARPENRHEKHPFRFIVGADGYCSFAERITDE